MFYVYILEDQKDHSWYIGYTAHLKQRLVQYAQGEVHTTCHKTDLLLIYYEAYRHKMDALGRERFLKSGAGWRFLEKQLRHHLASRPGLDVH